MSYEILFIQGAGEVTTAGEQVIANAMRVAPCSVSSVMDDSYLGAVPNMVTDIRDLMANAKM